MGRGDVRHGRSRSRILKVRCPKRPCGPSADISWSNALARLWPRRGDEELASRASGSSSSSCSCRSSAQDEKVVARFVRSAARRPLKPRQRRAGLRPGSRRRCQPAAAVSRDGTRRRPKPEERDGPWREAGTRPLGLSLYIASEVAKALDHAHRRRDEKFELLEVVHGDLGAENVLLSWDGEVKVSDFCVMQALWESRQRAPATRRPGAVAGFATRAPSWPWAGHLQPAASFSPWACCCTSCSRGCHPFLGATPRDTPGQRSAEASGPAPGRASTGPADRRARWSIERCPVDPGARHAGSGKAVQNSWWPSDTPPVRASRPKIWPSCLRDPSHRTGESLPDAAEGLFPRGHARSDIRRPPAVEPELPPARRAERFWARSPS